MKIKTITHVEPHLAKLVSLLIACVSKDASIGFIPPLSEADAHAYWRSQADAISSGEQVLFVAQNENDSQEIIGLVMLSLVQKANGRHRAEVEKLMVAPTARGRGVAQHLMLTLEQFARSNNRSLLVLDTRKGDAASQLYTKLGYTVAGEIPDFAANADGQLTATVYFYKLLQ